MTTMLPTLHQSPKPLHLRPFRVFALLLHHQVSRPFGLHSFPTRLPFLRPFEPFHSHLLPTNSLLLGRQRVAPQTFSSYCPLASRLAHQNKLQLLVLCNLMKIPTVCEIESAGLNWL